ncbi:MAG: hypothetical protein AB1555_06180 [Nitrospirota bacterium]
MDQLQLRRGAIVLGLILMLIAGCAASVLKKAETPGERFDRAMKEFAANCAKAKLKPNDTACDILKLKPADPLATEEGRFAHSIKIPNPVPEHSGYKPGMTPQEYFEHLCKTEAGEFIYKTVEHVEGVYQMRPRESATDYELQHLHAMEDPYGYVTEGAAIDVRYSFVNPSRFKFLENAATRKADNSEARYTRYLGYDARDLKSMMVEHASSLKSRYGYTWRGIRRPHDRELGIAGGELIVQDVQT